MAERVKISVVKGFYKHKSIPKAALADNLLYRFALIFHTDDPEAEDMEFPYHAFWQLFPRLTAAIQHDKLTISLDDCETDSLAKLKTTVEQNNAEDPPERCRLYLQNKLICLCETEFWVYCGGVQPYSDSYTISFYTNEKMSGLLQHEVLSVCLQNNYSIRNIIDADNPYKNNRKSFFAKLLNRH